MLRKNLEWAVGVFFFVAFIAAQFIFGVSASVKVLGVAGIVTGIVWIIGQSVPIGIESRPPSFFVRGLPAMLAGIAMIVIGIVLLSYSPEVACLLGWSSGKDCS